MQALPSISKAEIKAYALQITDNTALSGVGFVVLQVLQARYRRAGHGLPVLGFLLLPLDSRSIFALRSFDKIPPTDTGLLL
jgi:hypothetical protein